MDSNLIFNKCFEELMRLEGGYVNDRDDLGGETKYGISKKSYPTLNIAHLTLDEAKKIYKNDFFLKYRYNQLTSQEIACKLFTICVHSNSSIAGKIAQRALRAIGVNVKEDGIVGSRTIEHLNSNASIQLLCAMRSEQAGYYRMLVLQKPTNEKFINGWLNRAYS